MNGEGNIELDIAFLKTSGKLNIIVHDSGKGIEEEAIKKIYNEGFSTRGQGRGLGLSLVQETIAIHHGK